MIVEPIPMLDLFCRIELSFDEAKAISHSLGRTTCKGESLTISMELEDKLDKIISSHYNENDKCNQCDDNCTVNSIKFNACYSRK